MYLQNKLKENKVVLETDKYWTDNELGALAEAVTKLSPQTKQHHYSRRVWGMQRRVNWTRAK